MAGRQIDSEEAANAFGISASHEQMENGEVRFRLIADDNSAYVRTHAGNQVDGEHFGWQNSHLHKSVQETYVIQTGRMILAERQGEDTLYRSFTAGDVVSTKSFVPHNVYLTKGTIIHTVKVGGDGSPDWYADTDLDLETKQLSETEAMQKVLNKTGEYKIDPRYVPYVNMYMNLDNIIWRMPAFLTGGVTLLIGVSVTLLGSESGTASALVWGSVLGVSSLILFLGAYGLWRIRIHQALVGDELRKMDSEGYFQARERTKASFALPRAPSLYIGLFFSLSAILALGSVSVLSGNERLHEILNIPALP